MCDLKLRSCCDLLRRDENGFSMVSLDPKTEAFARDLSRLRSYLDLRKAQGRQSIVEIALESDFKKKLAELQTRLAELNRTICPDQAHRLIVSYPLEQPARPAPPPATPRPPP